jgi:hypothetical protein
MSNFFAKQLKNLRRLNERNWMVLNRISDPIQPAISDISLQSDRLNQFKAFAPSYAEARI